MERDKTPFPTAIVLGAALFSGCATCNIQSSGGYGYWQDLGYTGKAARIAAAPDSLKNANVAVMGQNGSLMIYSL